MKIVLDTSVFVDYTRAKLGPLPFLINLAKQKRAILYVPSVVILELWAGASMVAQAEQRSAKKLMGGMKIVELTRQLAEKAGELSRQSRVEDFIDASVAATALYLDAELATANKKHFEKVRGLKLFKN